MTDNKVFLFPGQGAQYLGMGKELFSEYAEARDVYNKANDLLGFDIAEVCFAGSRDELNKTSICQPAILTTSIAILNVLKNRCGDVVADCTVACGLSLGEYTAYVHAGAIAFEDAVRLVYMRGKFMQEACEKNPGGMVAVLRLDDSDVDAICDQCSSLGKVGIANYNSPGQLVVSGELEALDEVLRLVKEKGGKAVKLKVGGAFHSSLMSSAKGRLAEEINTTAISRPQIPVVANVSGEYISAPDQIRESLVTQLDNPVRWTQSMQRLVADGLERFYEFGPGNVLTGLMKKIAPSMDVKNIETAQSIEDIARNG